MKKIRVFLTAVALLFAVGATFAVQADDLLVNGFEYIPSLDDCRSIQNVDCQESGNNPCTSAAGYDVRKTSVTTCGASWKKP